MWKSRTYCPSRWKKKEGKVFLIRGDMDALPIKEESDVEFSCQKWNNACLWP